MEEVTSKIRKILRIKKLRNVCFSSLTVLLIIIGIVGMIVTSVRGEFNYLPLFCVIGVVLPIALLIISIIWLMKFDNGSERIEKILLESKLSADEIMSIGKKFNIDLFSLALTVRCKELGLSSVPEWCARDGVLPTQKEV